VGCNCGGSTPTAQQQAGPVREFRDQRVQAPPLVLRTGGPGDPTGGYYSQPPAPKEWNGPPRVDRG
jgi:hypothetical protein